MPAANIKPANKQKMSAVDAYRRRMERARRGGQVTELEAQRESFVDGDPGKDVNAAQRERLFNYASLNEHLLVLSLTRAVKRGEWRQVWRISLGWLFNHAAFVLLLLVYVVYGCVFEQISAADNSEAFLLSWLWSILQRFVAMEPIIILFGALVPMLFASEACANLCTESINMAVATAFAALVSFAKMLKGG